MSQKALKKDLEIVYRQIDLGGETVSALDRAFGILFEETLKRRGQAVKISTLTSNDN